MKGKFLKNINKTKLMLCVSTVLLLVSAIMFFMPFICYDYGGKHITFSGFDFFMGMVSKEQTVKLEMTRMLLGTTKTKMSAQTIAILSPAGFLLSLLLLVFTPLSIKKKKLNNIFLIGLFFAVWVMVMMSVITVVGRMGLIRGKDIINYYSIGFGIMVMVISVLAASILNIVVALMEDSKKKPVTNKPKANIPPMGWK